MSKGAKVARAFAILILFVTGVLGTYNGLTELGDGVTPWQHAVTIGVLIYGIFGLTTTYGLVRRRRWALATAIAWAVCVTYVPGLAVMAYAGEDAILSSAITASSASLLIAIAVLWIVNANTRHRGELRPTGA